MDTSTPARPDPIGPSGDGWDQVATLSREVRGLREALKSRSVIDQARGIVMAEASCSSERAWSVLLEVSQRTNVKLRDIAERLVGSYADGTLPAAVRDDLREALKRLGRA
ncbi:ANTAR domain-containing protein [Streptomyces sp. NPDC001108]